MARQALIPGVGYINETGTRQALIPGVGYVNETAGGADGRISYLPIMDVGIWAGLSIMTAIESMVRFILVLAFSLLTSSAWGQTVTFPDDGTVINHLAKLTGPTPSVTNLSITDITAIGIASTLPDPITRQVSITEYGIAICSFDGAVTVNDYFGASAINDGQCTDVGTSQTARTLGQILGTGPANAYQVLINTVPLGGGVGGSVTAVTAGACLTSTPNNPTTSTGTIAGTALLGNNGAPITATTYTIQSAIASPTDACTLLFFTGSAISTWTLGSAAVSGFGLGFGFQIYNAGTANIILNPTTSTLLPGSLTTLVIQPKQWVTLQSDGTNYEIAGASAGLLGESLNAVLPQYLGGLLLSNDGPSPNTVFETTAGAATSDDGTTQMNLAAFTKSTAAWAVGAANGCLDTGAVGNSSWYFVFLIERTDTLVADELCSLSATAPTMPASYTKKRLIGAFKTDGSAHILAYTCYPGSCLWAVAVLDVNDTTLSTSAVLETLGSVPTGLNVTPICNYSVGGTGNAVLLISPAVTDVAPSATTPFSAAPGFSGLDNTLTAGVQNTACPFLITNTSGQISARATASSTTLAIVTGGWRW